MGQWTRSQTEPTGRTRVPRVPAPSVVRSSSAGALALQRAIGNRATGRVLARWAAHPDRDKKGVLVPDALAAEYSRFNPPLSK